MNTIICGTYTVAEDKTFHYAGYECAAWSTDTLVPAGEYQVTAYVKDGHVAEFFATLIGTVVEDYFQSLSCGMPIGKRYDTKQNAGKPSTYTVRVYSYDVFKALGQPGCPWKIDLSLLPNIGHCLKCSTTTAGYNTFYPTLCVTCSVAQGKANETVVEGRFVRVLKLIQRHSDFTYTGSSSIAQAIFERSEWHRDRVANAIRSVRAARRMFPEHPLANLFVSTEQYRQGGRMVTSGRVHANGHFLGRLA